MGGADSQLDGASEGLGVKTRFRDAALGRHGENAVTGLTTCVIQTSVYDHVRVYMCWTKRYVSLLSPPHPPSQLSPARIPVTNLPLVCTNLQQVLLNPAKATYLQVDQFKFIFMLEDAATINHIVVFLLPDGMTSPALARSIF
jgi:hypothetical protein